MTACTCPLSLYSPDTGYFNLVRCGQCLGCRVRRKQAWVGRLLLENKCHPASRFLTLTYAEDPGILELKDLQDFLKRYRHHYGPCRYFAVGEYGEKNQRGHWHLIIFGHGPETRGHWKNNLAWNLGYSYDGSVNKESIGYVASYVTKWGDDREHAPICRQSLKPGIGFSMIGEMARNAPRRLNCWPSTLSVDGRDYPLSQGALEHFKSAYLESGGVAPPSLTPEILDAMARVELSDWGPRIQSERAALEQSYRLKVDRHALPKTPKTKTRNPTSAR